MATNDILKFGSTASGGNILSQAAYAADAQRDTGHQPGIARQELENKALLQLSTIAAGVAQYIANKQGTNVTDALSAAQIATMLGAAFGGQLLAVRAISSTQVYTPTAGTKSAFLRMVGGGGAGGGIVSTGTGNTSAGLGGSGGAYAEWYGAISAISGLVFTIGAGGASVVNGNGGAGGATSVGALITAPGGGGGSVGQNAAPPWLLGQGPSSAAPSGANVVLAIGQGGGGSFSVSLSGTISGQGGASVFGPGADSRGTIRAGGNAATNFGSGGSGALESSAGPGGLGGGAGAGGVVVVFEFGG